MISRLISFHNYLTEMSTGHGNTCNYHKNFRGYLTFKLLWWCSYTPASYGFDSLTEN